MFFFARRRGEAFAECKYIFVSSVAASHLRFLEYILALTMVLSEISEMEMQVELMEIYILWIFRNVVSTVNESRLLSCALRGIAISLKIC